MQSNSTIRHRLKLLKLLQTNDVDVCTDLFEASGYGHGARMREFVNFHKIRTRRWYSYPKHTNLFAQSKKRDIVLLIDSFAINRMKLLKLSKIYKHVILIEDGPIRTSFTTMTKINWEPGRHLVKRFHLCSNMFSSFSLYPHEELRSPIVDTSTLFAYFSTDQSELIEKILNLINLTKFKRVIAVGKNIAEIRTQGVDKYERLDNKIFDELFSAAGTVLLSGGNTFYKAMKQNKQIILYINNNKYLSWERRLAKQLKIEILVA